VGGRKSPSPIDLAHGLYNSLYYRTSRDRMFGSSRRNIEEAQKTSAAVNDQETLTVAGAVGDFVHVSGAAFVVYATS